MSGRWRRIFRLTADRRREELDEEIRIHLELRAEELVRQGWDPVQAEEEARRRFGSLDEARRDLARSARNRDLRLALSSFLDSVRDDVRLAVRQIRRTPGFVAVALITLGLGIGLTTSVYAVADGVLLRPLPFERADRLVVLMSVTEEGNPFPQVSSDNWMDWAEENRTLRSSAIFSTGNRPIADLPSGPVRVAAAEVSPGFFDVLGAPTVAGRTFTAGEVVDGAPVAVVSASFWRSEMGSRPLPADIRIAGERRTVVGALSGGVDFPDGTRVWLPRVISRHGFAGSRNMINWGAVARLRDGVTAEQARTDLSVIAAGIRERAPEGLYSWGVGVRSLHDFLVRDIEDRLLMLLAAVASVLLLACLNLAGLSVARTLRRLDEIGVRIALGAGRWRIGRQIVTEHLLLGLAGCLVGVGVAAAALEVLVRRVPLSPPPGAEISLDPRILAFSLGIAVVAGLLAGLVPALHATRVDSGWAVGRSRGTSGPARHRSTSLLVVGEVALALSLLVGGGLLVRSFQALVSRDLGFDPTGVVIADIPLDRAGYAYDFQGPLDQEGGARRRVFWSEVLERLGTDPEVAAVGMANSPPTVDGGNGFIEVERGGFREIGAGYRAVGGDYFRALGIPLLSGRRFDARDRAGTRRVTLVNRTMAETYWPDTDPIGRRVRAISMESFAGEAAPWLEVIGVVGDVRHDGYLRDATPEMYVLAEQVPFWLGRMNLVVDAGASVPASLPSRIREAVRQADPSLPVETSTLKARVDDRVSMRLFLTGLLTMFGVFAVLLAGIGLYGMLAFVVAGRTREIGIRAALGAGRGDLVGAVVGRSLRITAIGIVLGVAGAWATSRIIESLLVDVGAADPWAYGWAAAILLTAGVLAAAVPAWRATRVDPRVALTAE